MSNELNNIFVSNTIDSLWINELSKYYSIIEINDLNDLDLASNLKFTCAILEMGQKGSQEVFQGLLKKKLPIITLIPSENIHRHRKLIEMGAQDSLCIKLINSKSLQHSIELLIARKEYYDTARHLENNIDDESPIINDNTEALYFKEIVERIEDGLWIRGLDDRFIYINPGFSEIWGVEQELINDKNWYDAIHPDDRISAHKKYLELREKSEHYTLEYRIVRPNGDIRWIENKAYPIYNSHGEIIRRLGVIRDITVKRELEIELQMAQKLESLGQLAAGIAHEINTPSQYVSDNLSFLISSFEDVKEYLEELPAKMAILEKDCLQKDLVVSMINGYKSADISFVLEEFPLALTQSKEGIGQIKIIVQAMKGFSHPGESHEKIDINVNLSNTITVAKSEWKSVATLETDFDNTLPHISCIPSAINQVLLNLIINSVHAIEDANKDGKLGAITVSTKNLGDEVLITISDTGIGIPKDILQKIFDPFFTTKEVGKGTGQGLSIARKIINENHNGSLRVESTPGNGASFFIKLPFYHVPKTEIQDIT